MNPQAFANPPAACRGVTLWMLNDALEPDRLVAQLEGFKAAGWGAVIARTFNGLMTEYLSDEWMRRIDTIVTHCERLGLRLWLQAAYMPSAMPGLPPDQQYRGVRFIAAGETPPAGAEIVARDARGVYALERLETIVDLLDRDAVTAYLDRAYKETWHARFARHFGRTIEAVWVDEPHFRPGCLAWSRGLPARFRRDWGYEAADALPGLFFETGDWRKARHHYWRTAVALFLEGYFAPVSRWCAEHGVKFAGHLMGEDTLNSQISWTGTAMPAYAYMQLPGIDHLTMSLRWPTGKKFILTPKQMTSVANQTGTAEALAEMYGVSSHRITFADRKRIADWLFVLGVSVRCLHGSFYSMRGRRKRIYAPHLAEQQPWWGLNAAAGDYAARVSALLREGVRRADVLVLHPEESVFCVYDAGAQAHGHDRSREKSDIAAWDTRLVDLCDRLLGLQRDFEFGDETRMAETGRAEGAVLRIGRAEYRVVVLPELITLRRSTLDLLLRFADAGGTILAAGLLPERVDGLGGAGLDPADAARLARLRRAARPVAPERAALRAALDAAAAPAFRLADDAPDLWTHLREVDGNLALFLVNTSDAAPVRTALRWASPGLVEAWNPADGTVVPAPQAPADGGVEVPLDLPPLGSAVLVLRRAAAPRVLPVPRATVTETVTLGARPRVRRLGPNALTLDFARFRRGDGDWSAPTPVGTIQKTLQAENYAGPIALRYEFDVADVPARVAAAVERPETWEIEINGARVADTGAPHFIDRSFRPVDLSGRVRAGRNALELRTVFRPVPKASFALASLYERQDGTEIEAVYLVGDFAVSAAAAAAAAPERCLRITAPALAAEPANAAWNLTASGYAFFAGRVELSDLVRCRAPAPCERVVLRAADLHAPAAVVRVNGVEAGLLAWNPLELDVTAALREGGNEIAIEFASSLRNLLGPHHRDSGEPDNCWSTAWDDNRRAANVEHAEERGGWDDAWYCIHFGMTRPPVLEYRRIAAG